MMRRLSLFAALLFCAGTLRAQQTADSLRLYFRRGYSLLEPSVCGNQQTMDRLLRTLRSARTADPENGVLHLHVRGSASPDGSAGANRRLSEKRAGALLDLLRERAAWPDSLITVSAAGVDWEALTRWIESREECPAREELLDILHHTPLYVRNAAGRIVDGRNRRLMNLQGGVPYRYLFENCFPELRCATVRLCWSTAGTAGTAEIAGTAGTAGTAAEVRGVASSACESREAPVPGTVGESGADPTAPEVNPAAEEPAAEISAAEEPAAEELSAEEPAAGISDRAEVAGAVSGTIPAEPLYRLAVKTNLLCDAILMPSIEVEYRIDDRWSVAVEGDVAWWKRDRRHKYYQIATILPEGRCWFRTREPWHGHYLGLFAGGSWYDLENGARGYRGEFWTVGISYGYMFPIGRRWSLEAGLGVGFLRTRYEEYLPIDGHYVYQQTRRTNWIGPVKLKFALVCRLWDINGKGGRQ